MQGRHPRNEMLGKGPRRGPGRQPGRQSKCRARYNHKSAGQKCSGRGCSSVLRSTGSEEADAGGGELQCAPDLGSGRCCPGEGTGAGAGGCSLQRGWQPGRPGAGCGQAQPPEGSPGPCPSFWLLAGSPSSLDVHQLDDCNRVGGGRYMPPTRNAPTMQHKAKEPVPMQLACKPCRRPRSLARRGLRCVACTAWHPCAPARAPGPPTRGVADAVQRHHAVPRAAQLHVLGVLQGGLQDLVGGVAVAGAAEREAGGAGRAEAGWEDITAHTRRGHMNVRDHGADRGGPRRDPPGGALCQDGHQAAGAQALPRRRLGGALPGEVVGGEDRHHHGQDGHCGPGRWAGRSGDGQAGAGWRAGAISSRA